MKCILSVFILLSVAGCSNVKQISTSQHRLNGNWSPVQEVFAGTNMPKEAFQNQQLSLLDSTYKVVAESIDYGIVKYNGNKMDIYGKQGVNAGKHFMAIYKYENEFLTICYNLKGDSYPEVFETIGKPNFFLAVYKKN